MGRDLTRRAEKKVYHEDDTHTCCAQVFVTFALLQVFVTFALLLIALGDSAGNRETSRGYTWITGPIVYTNLASSPISYWKNSRAMENKLHDSQHKVLFRAHNNREGEPFST